MGTGFGTRGGWTPGGEKFFSVGCLFSRPGGDFAQKSQKMASPGGQKFFSPGCFAPRGAPPPCFFHAGCRAIFAHHAWATNARHHCALKVTSSRLTSAHFWCIRPLQGHGLTFCPLTYRQTKIKLIDAFSLD